MSSLVQNVPKAKKRRTKGPSPPSTGPPNLDASLSEKLSASSRCVRGVFKFFVSDTLITVQAGAGARAAADPEVTSAALINPENLYLAEDYDRTNVFAYSLPPPVSEKTLNPVIADAKQINLFLTKLGVKRGSYNNYDRLTVPIWNAIVIGVPPHSALLLLLRLRFY